MNRRWQEFFFFLLSIQGGVVLVVTALFLPSGVAVSQARQGQQDGEGSARQCAPAEDGGTQCVVGAPKHPVCCRGTCQKAKSLFYIYIYIYIYKHILG